MTRTLTRVLLALGAMLMVLPAALTLGSPAQAAELGTKATYNCQYDGPESEITVPNGLPAPDLPATGGNDDVAVKVTVDAPKTVEAGEPLRLKGSATFVFGPNATATNGATIFRFLSDSFGLDIGDGLSHRFVRIAELRTTQSEAGSSKVTARWSLPDYLVPGTAQSLSLALPYEALATNPVSSSPESVAFTGTLETDSRLQPERTVACSLPQDLEGKEQDTTVGSIKVVGGTSGATAVGGSSTTGGAAPAASAPAGSSAPAGAAAPASAPGAAPGAAAQPAAAQEAATTLAGEAVPPATVAPGLRVPAWLLPFAIAFVLGGPVTALASYRRARRATIATAAVLALLVVPSPLNPKVPAQAATGQAQITMICVYEAEGSDPNDVPKDQPTGVNITLDVPESVAPGQVVSLTGSASVQAPEDIRRQASQFGYTTLDAISYSFSVGLTIGSGSRQVFVADRWQTGKTAFSNPLVVRGPLNFPAFKVPEDATGSVKLELPRNEVVDRRPPPYRNAHTPPKVAVEFMAEVSGNGTSATYIVSCWRNDKSVGTIADIPVKTAGSAPAAAPSAVAGAAPSQAAAAAGPAPAAAGAQ